MSIGDALQKFLANTFLMIISLVMAFILAEIFARNFMGPKTLFTGQNQLNRSAYIRRPYVMGVADPRMEGINSLGYRGSLPVMPKPEGEIRIMVVGGSTVYGIDDNQLCQFLQKEFGEGSRYQVYNFGIKSSVLQQDYVRMAVDLVHFNPDLIISYGPGNDFYHPTYPGTPHRFHYISSNPVWQTDVADYPYWRMFFFGSELLRRIFRYDFEEHFLGYAHQYNFQIENDYYKDRIFHYRETLKLMNNFSESLDAKFLAVLQPVRGLFFPTENKFDKEVQRFYGRLREALKGKDMKFPHLDLSHINDKKKYWEDHIHITKEGNMNISRLLAKEIRRVMPLN